MRAHARRAMVAALGTFRVAPLGRQSTQAFFAGSCGENRAPPAIIFSPHRHRCRARPPLRLNRVIKQVVDTSAGPRPRRSTLGIRIEAKGQERNWQSLRGTKTLEIKLGSLPHGAILACFTARPVLWLMYLGSPSPAAAVSDHGIDKRDSPIATSRRIADGAEP
jgi:hypothetical protein